MVLLQHPWPGEREGARKCDLSASLVAVNDFIDVHDLPEQLQNRTEP